MSTRARRPHRGLAAVAAAALGLAGCAPTADQDSSETGAGIAITHIHAAVRDPGTGDLLLATHQGLYRQDGADGEALIRTPLKELLAQLDERDFLQVHRSVIVARRHIASAVRVDEGQMHLTLRGRRETLPVSRPFQGLFKGQ